MLDFFDGAGNGALTGVILFTPILHHQPLTKAAGFIASSFVTDEDAEDRHGRRWRNDKDQWVSGIYPTPLLA
ncbi:MAG: hypothetical protein WAU74_18260, partial [Pseudolabrys sp.]